MTPHKHAAVIHAWADGASIEVKGFDGNWVAKDLPDFYLTQEYRVKPIEYSVGTIFTIDASRYLLAQVGSARVCLVCLKTGNRLLDPVYVCDPWRITEEEFEKIVDTFKKL